jgi:hypothetical protein
MVAKLTDIGVKVDTLLQIVAKLTSDNMPPAPELPDDITLPLESLEDLEKVENAVTNNSEVKHALVSFCLYEKVQLFAEWLTN